MAEMIKATPEVCVTCEYGSSTTGNTSKGGTRYFKGCNYLCMTGRLRGCPVGECDKYEKMETRKRKQEDFIYGEGSPLDKEEK